MWPENGFYNIFIYYQNSGCISLLPAHKHFRGKWVGLSLAMLFSRHEISPNPLALSLVSAMHLSVPSTPISNWANNFRSNETTISIRHECCTSPGLLLESRVHCAGWSLTGRGFQESWGVLRAGDETQCLSGLAPTFQQAPELDKCRFGLNKICQESEGLPGMCLDIRLHRHLYIRVIYFSIKSIFVLLLLKCEENHQRGTRDLHHA